MKKVIVGLAGLSLLITGCTSGSSPTPPAGESEKPTEETPVELTLRETSLPYVDGKECTVDMGRSDVTFGIHAEPSGMDPASPAHPSANSQLAAIYSTLMTYDYDSDEFIPVLAEGIDSNEDSTVWTLTLRDGLEFSSGDPLNADVVKASIERFTDDSYVGFLKSEANLVESIEVVDPKTVKFSLTKSWGAFPFFLTRNAGMIVNPVALEREGAEAFNAFAPEDAGAGAFTLKAYTPGQEIVLKGKADWQGDPVCIETLNIPLMADPQMALDALNAGQVDAFQTFVSNVIRKVRDSDTLDHIVLPTYLASPLVTNISGGAPLDNQEVRRAMMMAVDIDAVSERINDGISDTSRTVIPQAIASAPKVDPLPYDPEAAAKIIAEQGELAEVVHITNAVPMQENLMILVNSMWRAAGLNMADKTMPQNQLVQEIYSDRNFGVVGWATSVDPACIWCGLSNMTTGASANISGYSNPDMDAAVAKVQSAVGPEEISKALDGVQTIWNDTVPSPHNGFMPYTVTVQEKFQGLRLGTASMIRFEKAFVG